MIERRLLRATLFDFIFLWYLWTCSLRSPLPYATWSIPNSNTHLRQPVSCALFFIISSSMFHNFFNRPDYHVWNTRIIRLKQQRHKGGAMNCPYFRQTYVDFCDAPAAVHVPTISEMETYCFRAQYKMCPKFTRVMPRKTSQFIRKSGAA